MVNRPHLQTVNRADRAVVLDIEVGLHLVALEIRPAFRRRKVTMVEMALMVRHLILAVAEAGLALLARTVIQPGAAETVGLELRLHFQAAAYRMLAAAGGAVTALATLAAQADRAVVVTALAALLPPLVALLQLTQEVAAVAIIPLRLAALAAPAS